MMRWIVMAALVAAAPAWAQADLARARALLARAPVIDGHNDVPGRLRELRAGKLDGFDFGSIQGEERAKYHTDLDRLKAGGVGGVFWSVYVSATLGRDEAVRVTFEQIDITKRLIAANAGRMTLVTTAAEAERAMRAGRVASFLGAEGGHSIANSMGTLRELHRSGVRYMTITHNLANDWADSATDEPKHNGLTAFGREVIGEMNRLGMLVDLSHVSPKTMLDTLDVAAAPVIFSHSSARGVTDHPRNVPDEVLRRLPANGGLVMVTFVPPFVNERFRVWAGARAAEEARLKFRLPFSTKAVADGLVAWEAANARPEATARDVADHVDHVRRLAGIDNIGIGSDFDGVPYLPVDLASAEMVPNLFAELARRGYSDADLAKIAQGNVLRVLRAAEGAAARLGRERGASTAVVAVAP